MIIQFGDEDDQDRALGLTGLYVKTSRGEPDGYGKLGHINYDGRTVSIFLTDGTCAIDAIVDTDTITNEAINEAARQCNRANETRL